MRDIMKYRRSNNPLFKQYVSLITIFLESEPLNDNSYLLSFGFLLFRRDAAFLLGLFELCGLSLLASSLFKLLGISGGFCGNFGRGRFHHLDVC